MGYCMANVNSRQTCESSQNIDQGKRVHSVKYRVGTGHTHQSKSKKVKPRRGGGGGGYGF